MRAFVIAMSVAVSALPLLADTAQSRLQAATEVFQEIMATPEKGIPQDLLEKANCIVIVPGLKKGAFIVGGSYGRGFALCRHQSGTGWGAPAAVRIEGGSFGFQIGASSTDLVMLVMNQKGMDRLLQSKFTIGADASAAAGPVGRTAEAKTDAFLGAEILAWSRARGAFAGISLNGATLRPDMDENQELYGKRLDNREILTTNLAPPPAAQTLITQLNRYSRHEEGTANADRSVQKHKSK